jgi:uncharacterized protein YjbI with pentapeptide repeats
MVNLMITMVIISLLTATIGIFIALKIQSRVLKDIAKENEAWQHAQAVNQHIWEVKQGKLTLELEQKFLGQVQQIQEAWLAWEVKDVERLARLTLEQKIALLPRIEDVSVTSNEPTHAARAYPHEPYEQTLSFFQADLSGQDLSHRYLAQADLREAQLVNTNLYMADLSGACLTGANLAGANLTGANLMGADLRDAVLTGAILLVADLNGAFLNGTNLLGVHYLTNDQFKSANYNNMTQMDAELNQNLPRTANDRLTDAQLTSTPDCVDVDATIPISKYARNGRAKAN